jgi:hypothetical protein
MERVILAASGSDASTDSSWKADGSLLGRGSPRRCFFVGEMPWTFGIDESRVVVLLRPQQALGRLVRIGFTRFG